VPAVRYLERFQQTLVNPTWAQIVEREPLIAFSHYLSGRVNVLCSFADEILENLDKGFSGQCVDGGRIERAESLMWFWLLGAYEVVRTMHQAKRCFSDRLVDELSSLKKILAFDEEACLQQAYEAMLKASLGFMFSHGFRARSQPGHHIAIIDFVRSRIDKKHAGLLVVFDRLRRKRNMALM
jgi:hypothetical protein